MPFREFITKFSPLSPSKLVKSLYCELEILGNPSSIGKMHPKCLQNISKYLIDINNILLSEYKHKNEESCELILAELSSTLFETGILILMVKNIEKLEFEARKVVGYIFTNLLNEKSVLAHQFVHYLVSTKEIVYLFMESCQYVGVGKCLTFGQLVLECSKFESLFKIILESQYFWLFFTLAESQSFEVASIATKTLRTLLVTTQHKSLCAEFLNKNYENVFGKFFPQLLESTNFVSQIESLSILYDILFQIQHRSIVKRFISSSKNLKSIMILLGNPSNRLSLRAFNVFKVFFALNEGYDSTVQKILFNNKEKIAKILLSLSAKYSEDETILQELEYIIPIIKKLKKPLCPTKLKFDENQNFGPEILINRKN